MIDFKAQWNRCAARVIPAALLAATMAISSQSAYAQLLLRGRGPGGSIRIQHTDMAVLEAGDDRTDLDCTVSPSTKAFLGFDLRFHAGYDIGVPLKELAGTENLLTVLFRVHPKNRPEDKKYFLQRIRVPSIEADAKGDTTIQGGFDTGEGNYHVALLVRDRSERVCAHSWDVEADLPAKDKTIPLVLDPSEIAQAQRDQFGQEPPVERSTSEPALNVKVIVNFAPQKANAATLLPTDTSALVSILRTISREPRFRKFSLVAFNMHEQRVINRQDNVDRINFPALGDSLETLNLGAVDLLRLSQKHGNTAFLTSLISKELGASTKPDAIIFAGPKSFMEENVSKEELDRLGQLDCPVFYMNYSLYPNATPWRDAIGSAVKALKGTEFVISRPRDLWFAVSEMVSSIVKFRNGKQVAAVSSK